MVNYIETTSELTDLLNSIKGSKGGLYQLDIETTGFDPYTNKILLIQIGGKKDQMVINYHKVFAGNGGNVSLLRSILEDPAYSFILHNGKFDYKFFKHNMGIRIADIHDTMVMAHLVRAGMQKKGYGLADLLDEYNFGTLDKSIRDNFIDHDGIDFTTEEVGYAAEDVEGIRKLYYQLLSEVSALGLDNVYNLERSCIQVTGDMELNGIGINVSAWAKLEAVARRDALVKRGELDKYFEPYCDKDMFGVLDINYDSPKQVKPVLEKELGFKIDGTGKDVLEKLALKHDICASLLEYRTYAKRISAFGMKFLGEHVNPVTGRIHTSFIQTGATDSGRYASRGPNMQQIPAESAYRAAFVASHGWKIVGSDYAGMELRLLAEFSEDESFMRIFSEDLDAHRYVSSLLTGVDYDDITKEQRKIGKSINFGIIYGMGPGRLSKAINKSYQEAKDLMDKFLTTFPGINTFLQARVDEALADECVRSFMDGRLRWLKGFNLRVPRQRAHAANIAKNMSLQSGNASITKLALVMLDEALRDRGWEEDALIILTVHDEIQMEVKEELAESVSDLLSSTMVSAAEHWIKKVPIVAEATIGDHWSK